VYSASYYGKPVPLPTCFCEPIHSQPIRELRQRLDFDPTEINEARKRVAMKRYLRRRGCPIDPSFSHNTLFLRLLTQAVRSPKARLHDAGTGRLLGRGLGFFGDAHRDAPPGSPA